MSKSNTRYPVEDGPGSGRIAEAFVRVLIGLERSTVIVSVGGRAVMHEVREHGAEIEGVGAAVEEALRQRVHALLERDEAFRDEIEDVRDRG